jgi:hypothetical protein
MFVSIYRNPFIIVALSAIIVSGLGLYECYRLEPDRTLYKFVGTPIYPPMDQRTDIPMMRLLSPLIPWLLFGVTPLLIYIWVSGAR